ncbi:MAG TPA: response regulator [Candidatus Cottocaccamicrobium excrementipullorum]|nr:response regulator [Candidatus Cottocaccamicrobium excrementipullorum]
MKILIADDELLVRITVIKALNDLGIQNSDIYQADCGEAMIKLLKSTSIDIAFVDIKMPDISGLETIFYKGIMPSEKVLDFPVDCNTLTGSVNL